MKNLDDFMGNDKRKPLDFSCQCTSCGSNNTNIYKGEEKDMFDAKCVDCDNKFSFRLPGMGSAF